SGVGGGHCLRLSAPGPVCPAPGRTCSGYATGLNLERDFVPPVLRHAGKRREGLADECRHASRMYAALGALRRAYRVGSLLVFPLSALADGLLAQGASVWRRAAAG